MTPQNGAFQVSLATILQDAHSNYPKDHFIVLQWSQRRLSWQPECVPMPRACVRDFISFVVLSLEPRDLCTLGKDSPHCYIPCPPFTFLF